MLRSALTLALLARGSVRTPGSFTDPGNQKGLAIPLGIARPFGCGEGKPPTVDFASRCGLNPLNSRRKYRKWQSNAAFPIVQGSIAVSESPNSWALRLFVNQCARQPDQAEIRYYEAVPCFQYFIAYDARVLACPSEQDFALGPFVNGAALASDFLGRFGRMTPRGDLVIDLSQGPSESGR